jgi:hypothetical protein
VLSVDNDWEAVVDREAVWEGVKRVKSVVLLLGERERERREKDARCTEYGVVEYTTHLVRCEKRWYSNGRNCKQ